jgi:hypothetical protein
MSLKLSVVNQVEPLASALMKKFGKAAKGVEAVFLMAGAKKKNAR